MGHALASDADHLAVLRAGGNAHFRVGALDRRDVDLVAKRGLSRREAREVNEIVALPPEEVVLLEPDEDIEVTGWSSAHTGLALTGDAQLLAVVDARGNGQSDLAVLALAAFPAAAGALLVDRLAGPAAAWAGGDVHEAPEHRLLHLAHLAATVAGRARRRRRSRLRTVPVAALARLEPRHRDDSLAALDGVEEVDLDLHPEIGAAHRTAGLAPAEVTAEERLEEVADPELAEAPGPGADHVVALSPLRVGQHLVRLGDRLEALRGVRCAVHVRVVLPRELPVGAPDLLVRRRARDAEENVVVGRRGHLLSLSRPMEAVFRIAVQWLHVTAGVLWIGGGFYTILVQLPALLATPPAARGAIMPNLVPRQFTYIFRVAEFTILTGLLNLFASGRAQELTRLDTRWSWAILAGIILAVGVYAMTRATIARWAYRLVEIGPLAASGDAAAAAQMPLLGARIRRFGYIQLTIGVLILLAMVTARFS